MPPTQHVYLVPQFNCGTRRGRFIQKNGRSIKKAPGKYVVLGGRRTTRLKSREPVDWSSTQNQASLPSLIEHFSSSTQLLHAHIRANKEQSVRSKRMNQLPMQDRLELENQMPSFCCQSLNMLGRIGCCISEGQDGFTAEIKFFHDCKFHSKT